MKYVKVKATHKSGLVVEGYVSELVLERGSVAEWDYLYATSDYTKDDAILKFVESGWTIEQELELPTKPGALIRVGDQDGYYVYVRGKWFNGMSGFSYRADEFQGYTVKVLFEGEDR